MEQKRSKAIVVFSVIFYVVALAFMILGTVKDLQIDISLFNPENLGAKYAEQFSQLIYWGLWGPAFGILFVCRHTLKEATEIISRVFPFVKPVSNTDTKAYKIFNTILNIFTGVAFFALSVIGWKKLIENVVKNILKNAGAENLSQIIYFVICIVVSVIAILILSRIDKSKLRKFEYLALAGILLGIFYKIVEECKEITNRVRFREMIAFSNNLFDDEGMTNGAKAELNSSMVGATDFSHFTPWYKIGDDAGVYKNSNSFPSGHTTYCCTLFLTYPLCLAVDKLRKLAPVAYIVSALYVILVAFTRMVMGAHYLTDVAGAAIIGYSLFLVVLKIYNSFTKKNILG